jgi:YVTN family beta-propeller protein
MENMKKITLTMILIIPIYAQATLPKVYVVNTGEASISLVDLEAKKELSRIKVGNKPYGIALSRDEKLLAVGVEAEETVKIYSTSTQELVSSVKIGSMANDHIALTPDGKNFAVANYHSNSLVLIDAIKHKISGRIEGFSAPHVIKFGPVSKKAYLTLKKEIGIGAFDFSTDEKKVLQLKVNPRSLTFSTDEAKLYFASFWVDGIFEFDIAQGKVSRFIPIQPPKSNSTPMEVTYHGVENIYSEVLVTTNEGRSILDSINPKTGKLLDRSNKVSNPCCAEAIFADKNSNSVLISNLGDDTLQIFSVNKSGKLSEQGKIKVGADPKRVAIFGKH